MSHRSRKSLPASGGGGHGADNVVREVSLLRFINPNFHVILIHYPLALLTVGLLLELLAIFRPAVTLRAAASWMVLLGALAGAPAAASGIFAKYDVMQQLAGADDGATWHDIRVDANLTRLQTRLLNRHVLYSSIGSALALLTAVVWLGLSPRWPQPLGAPLWLIFAVSMGLMVVGSQGAGEMVYRTQFATRTQAAADKLQADWNSRMNSATGREKLMMLLDYYVDPLQAHVIVAGLVMALAAAAYGTSLQKSAQLRLQPSPDQERAQAPVQPPATAPATALWVLTALAAALAVLIGWYVFSKDAPSPLDVTAVFKSAIWQPFRKDPADGSRVLAHLALGSAIVLLAILLVLSAKWGARRQLLIGFLGLVMLAVIAAQIGVGVLMLYDTDSGPLTHFNPAEQSASQ